jgi:hypothetical protein
VIKQVIFPARIAETRYYRVHVKYIIDTAKAVNIDIRFDGNTSVGNCKFSVKINGKLAVFDFSNHIDAYLEDNCPCFKFQYSVSNHSQYKHIFPFTKVSFYNWLEYDNLRRSVKYMADGIISCRQRPYANAKSRRLMVQGMLKKQFGARAMTSLLSQPEYWKEINKCMVGVFVPGARNDILDRGQVQYMALGCCTISPEIIDIFPYNRCMAQDEHYVMCKPDYSNLIDKIKWCENNKLQCIEIGRQAQNLFLETSTPSRLWQWIEQCIGEFYG